MYVCGLVQASDSEERSMTKVAVVGASGFLGTAVAERLLAQKIDFVPLIHSSGNAWRLARLGLSLPTVNILSRIDLEKQLAGCTHVVNCSRGTEEVMLKGLRTLIKTCVQLGIRRLVHISSVAVYGDPPHPQSTEEPAPTEPEKGSYGWIKLQQDNLVRKATEKGLAAVLLCPPNISGPLSTYVGRVLDAVRKGEFALLEGGNTPCNLVDVNNLAYAVELALERGTPDGRRLFVTDGEATTWRDLLSELRLLPGICTSLPEIDRQSLVALRDKLRKPPIRLTKSLKHLISSDVRRALRKDPLLERIDTILRNGVGQMGRSVEEKLRLAIEGPLAANNSRRLRINVALCAQQLRGVIHQCERAKNEIGYKPLHTFAESMAAYRRWYIQHHGLNTSYKDLILELH
jgi:nucleoside-diphosphate-sugar epimerase